MCLTNEASAADGRAPGQEAAVSMQAGRQSQRTVLDFPADRSVGNLTCVSPSGASKSLTARGRISVPSGCRTKLDVNYQTGLDLSPLRGLASSCLDELNLAKLEITDDQLANIKHLAGLRHLDLGETDIGDRGLNFLSDMHNLQFLDVHSTCITAKGLVPIGAHKSLTDLNLSNNNIGDSGLMSLRSLTSLRSLRIARCSLTDAGLRVIGALPSLTGLDLEWNAQITDIGIGYLARLKHLETLDAANTSFTAHATRYLAKMPALNCVVYGASNLKGDDLAMMRKALPRCRVQSNTEYRNVNINLWAPLH